MGRCIALILCTLSAAQLAVAANTCTWKGTGANNNWSTLSNWTCSGTGFGSATLVFPDGVSNRTSNNDLASISLAQLKFQGLDYTITGNTISLSQGIAANLPAPASGTHGVSISNAITLTAAQTFNCTGATPGNFLQLDTGTLNLSGHRLTISGLCDTRLAGKITGAGGLTMNGFNKLTVSAPNNNYTGVTTINDGKIIVRDNTALGSSNDGTVVAAGAILEIQTDGVTIPEPITLSGDLWNDAHVNTITGAITLGDDASLVNFGILLNINGPVDLNGHHLNNQGQIVINGVISGTGGIGASTRLSLTGANTYSGPTTIFGLDELVVANDSALGATGVAGDTTNVFSSGTLTLAANVSEPLVMSGGILRLSGGDYRADGIIVLEDNTFVDVANGTLTLAGGVSGSFNLAKKGNGLLRLENLNSQSNTSVNSGTLELNGAIGDIVVAGKLTGTGDFDIGTLNTGTLAPGPTFGWKAGTLSGSELDIINIHPTLGFRLGPSDAQSDRLLLSGSFANTTASTLFIQVYFYDGATPPISGHTYTLVTFAAHSGIANGDFHFQYSGTGPGTSMTGTFALTASELQFTPSTVVSDLLFRDGFE